jgi:hypothetical protein
MRECSHCGRRASALDRSCSTCSAPLIDEPRTRPTEADGSDLPEPLDEAGLAPIARFLNAAEAGYFAHELKLAEGVPVVITAEENFDAVAGYWSTRFLLCVPKADALGAAEALQRLVEETESDDFVPRHAAEFVDDADAGRQTTDVFNPRTQTRGEISEPVGVGWVPLVLTLAAGSAAFWGVRRVEDQPRPPAAPIKRPDAEQWKRLPGPGRPWTFPHENGHGERQFWLDQDRSRAVVREDANGDGFFETEQRHELPAR